MMFKHTPRTAKRWLIQKTARDIAKRRRHLIKYRMRPMTEIRFARNIMLLAAAFKQPDRTEDIAGEGTE